MNTILNLFVWILNERGEVEASIKVSIFASAVRVAFYKTFLDSLLSTSIPYEVIFCGHNTREQLEALFGTGAEVYCVDEVVDNNLIPIESYYPAHKFKYRHTAKIKPAQCYEIARRACKGELSHYTADDCEYSHDLLGKAYDFWKAQNNEKTVLSIQTIENGMYCDMKVHSFFGCQYNTPLMAPLALYSTKLAQDLGGFDRRYICGQYENDFVMRVIEAGGEVKIFGDKENFINIDHYKRHGIVRPFATGYNHDREILEGSWTNGAGKVFLTKQRPFEPYEDKEILFKSQSFINSNWI